MKAPVIAIAGNPNSGKTTLFNALTGTRQRVGNWPGVTVEKKTGNCRVEDRELELVDLPGIYSFSASSEDEIISRDFLVSGNAELVLNIVDATSLERGLLLTLQLLEMGVPVVVVANMMDLVKERNLHLDIDGLSRELDCPVVPMSASKGKGLKALKSMVLEKIERPEMSKEPISRPPAIQQALPEISALLDKKKDLADFQESTFTGLVLPKPARIGAELRHPSRAFKFGSIRTSGSAFEIDNKTRRGAGSGDE